MKTIIRFSTSILAMIILLTVSSCEEEVPDWINEDLSEEISFSHLPTDLDKMLEFSPIGALQGVPKAHGGFRLKQFDKTPDIPVFAMSDGYIYRIIKDTRTADLNFAPDTYQDYVYEDYTVEIAVARKASMWYGHISRLSDEILNEAGDLKGGAVENNVKIEVQAGQIIGFLGPHPGFDIGMYDFTRTQEFSNPGRYSEYYRHAQPFTDYLSRGLREEIWKINPRTIAPRGGKINFDKAGALSGNWFLEGTTSILEWSKQLVFATHHVHADRLAIMDGSPLLDGNGINNTGRFPYTWFVMDKAFSAENFTPASGLAKVEVVTYWRLLDNPQLQQPNGTLLLKMQDEQTLQYQFFPGKNKDQVSDFSGTSKQYKR